MGSLNQANIIGFVGADPRINVTGSGKKVATFSVATTEPGFTTREGKVVPERTEWHYVVFRGRPAEVAERYIRKGSQVFVQGKIRTRGYLDSQGQPKFSTEIEGEQLQLLGRTGNNMEKI